MLKAIITLGTGLVLGHYYKSYKDKNKIVDGNNEEVVDIENQGKDKKLLSKILK